MHGQELTVSPSQEHLVVSSSDNAVTLVGLAGKVKTPLEHTTVNSKLPL